MCGLCALAVLTVWKMSTPPSTLTLSISDMQVMNTPVRDIPSLEGRRQYEHMAELCICCLLDVKHRGKVNASVKSKCIL